VSTDSSFQHSSPGLLLGFIYLLLGSEETMAEDGTIAF
jgi:hypothetical protein